VASQVGREAAGRLVAARAVLLQALHHDPVEVAAQQQAQPLRIGAPLLRHARTGHAEGRDARARLVRLVLADGAQHLVEALLEQRLDVEAAHLGLLG
jgi:hypothetical protein